jgi:glycyl-tRNA synthetase beta chain
MIDHGKPASEFLLEVRAEEIPARMLPGAVQELGTGLFEELMRRGLVPTEVSSAFTPRRLVLVLKGLPEKEGDKLLTEVGPPASAAYDAAGNPTPAAIGFAKKFGMEASSLKRRLFSGDEDASSASGSQSTKGGKGGGKGKIEGERVYLERTYAGRPTAEVLSEIVPKLLAGLNWAKTMRWGNGAGPWVRPVHGIMALLDGEIVPFGLFGVRSGRETAGHPTLSPGSFPVFGLDDYHRKLAERGIVVEPAERKRLLRQRMAERVATAGGTLVEDDALLDKLAAICEIPGVMEGAFAADLTELPREVLTTSLRDHQSALTVERDGRLLPLFLTVMDRPDDPAGRVRAGNEWVVAARLADARFFWGKDRAQPLASRAEALGSLAFQEKLGSYAAKTARLQALAADLADRLGAGGAAAAAQRAAALAKIDLATEMVREFTSLQGVMGGIYAREDGEPEAVWQAVYDQYLPAGADDALPRGDVGRILALADRVDTLVGFFGLGRKFWPSGSRDPFGLRRAALGVVRLVLEGGSDLDLGPVFARARELYGAALPAAVAEESQAALVDFLHDRVEFLLGRRGLAYDEIGAARGAAPRSLDFRALAARADAVHEARTGPEFLAVALAARRIANILKGTEPGEVDPAGLGNAAERALHQAATTFRAAVDGALAAGDYGRGLAAVGALAAPLERFFVEVLVMDPDEGVRRNRLALLAGLRRDIGRLADLSVVVVDKSEYR